MINLCASEHKVHLLLAEIGATLQRNEIEKIVTIRIGDKEQCFWMDSWSVALKWIREQREGKRA